MQNERSWGLCIDASPRWTQKLVAGKIFFKTVDISFKEEVYNNGL